ncbi:MAG: YdeI/OmpD-associated family protein [Spirochaetia bacterium]|nr:YdeI/OmpD-associated family protein [Spirochaetia bacterium]
MAELPVLTFKNLKAWETWLEKNGSVSNGIWIRIAKKNSGTASVTYPEAVEGALCYGWIDGQKNRGGEEDWLQKFTPRGKKSIWSKINREKVLALIKSRNMKKPGLAEVERAKKDGRWENAYDSARTSVVPSDFQKALDSSPRAKKFFENVNASNRYAVLFRIQTSKKPETRANWIQKLTAMLERGETLHPAKKK